MKQFLIGGAVAALTMASAAVAAQTAPPAGVAQGTAPAPMSRKRTISATLIASVGARHSHKDFPISDG